MVRAVARSPIDSETRSTTLRTKGLTQGPSQVSTVCSSGMDVIGRLLRDRWWWRCRWWRCRTGRPGPRRAGATTARGPSSIARDRRSWLPRSRLGLDVLERGHVDDLGDVTGLHAGE